MPPRRATSKAGGPAPPAPAPAPATLTARDKRILKRVGPVQGPPQPVQADLVQAPAVANLQHVADLHGGDADQVLDPALLVNGDGAGIGEAAVLGVDWVANMVLEANEARSGRGRKRKRVRHFLRSTYSVMPGSPLLLRNILRIFHRHRQKAAGAMGRITQSARRCLGTSTLGPIPALPPATRRL